MNPKVSHKILDAFFSTTVVSGTIEGEFFLAFESEEYGLVFIVSREEPEMNKVKVTIRSVEREEEDVK